MIIAKQIPIDRQESPIEIYGGADCYYDDVCVLDYAYSNNCFRMESEEYKKIKKIFDNSASLYFAMDFCDDEDYESYFRTLNPTTELPPMEVMRATIDNYFGTRGSDSVEAVRMMLEYMTEKEYKVASISGSVQGEFGYVIYPSDRYTDDDIDKLGMEVYNTGTEWGITFDEDDNPEYFYSHGYNNDTNRKEIAEAFGVEPSEVILEVFTGYTKVANYERR